MKYTGLLLFPDLHAACAAIAPLRNAGAAALELMDRASLRSVEDKPGIPSEIKAFLLLQRRSWSNFRLLT